MVCNRTTKKRNGVTGSLKKGTLRLSNSLASLYFNVSNELAKIKSILDNAYSKESGLT